MRRLAALSVFFIALGLTAAARLTTDLAVYGSAYLRTLGSGLPFDRALASVATDPTALGLGQLLGFSLALSIGWRWTRALRRKDADALDGSMQFGGPTTLQPVAPRWLLLTFVAGLSLQIPLAELANWLQLVAPFSIQEQLQMQRLLAVDNLPQALGLLFALVVVAPFTEELLFRGVLLPRLAERYGDRAALLLSSALFGIVHVHPVAVGVATIAGVLLGALALAKRRLWICIALHAGVNALPILLPEQLVSIRGFNTVSEGVYHLPIALLLGGLVVSVGLLVLLFRRFEPMSSSD